MARHLEKFGLCTFYADESDDKHIYSIACICVPTIIRRLLGAQIRVEWDTYLAGAKEWRRGIKETFGVPVRKELKGSQIATGRNSYGPNNTRIHGQQARELYAGALQGLTFLPKGSIFSVYAKKGVRLYGHKKLEAALYALFQRMQKHCEAWGCNALLFFDEGHEEYRHLFQKACAYLPTGSRLGGWPDGKRTKSMPFTAAIKDANFKNSKSSHLFRLPI
jgi:hypothetical protein